MPGDPMDEMQQREMDDAIVEALGDTPRAAELARLKSVLADRRAVLQKELDSETDLDEKHRLEQRMAELEEQISILTEEFVINQFVEDAIQFSHEMRKLQN